MKTVAIYGGTFSPPHMGHYRALASLISAFSPDKTYVIPTLLPPHKTVSAAATPEQRLAMCHLAFDELEVEVSELEIRRGGKSYTVLTLQELSAPDTRLLLLCGTDMFLSLDSWYMPERIFELAEIVYAVREEGEEGKAAALAMAKRAEEYRTRFGATVHALPLDSLELSSSEIRAMLSEGQDTGALLHPKVKEYIERCNLYHA